jgi:hypothetical protein
MAGSAVAFSKPIVHQMNIQVVAVVDGEENTSQTASNNVDITQTTGAMAGNATSTDCGAASTGSAVAGSLVVVHQLNIQVIAGYVPAGGVSQDASNDAQIDQTTLAGSGNALADGNGTTVRTGNAGGMSYAFVFQRNIQIYVGTQPGLGSSEQSAANQALIDQTVAAATGEASGASDSESTSGNAKARAVDRIRQQNTQIIFD